MAWPRPVASQPERPVDAPQIEALGCLVLIIERRRGDGDRARRGAVSRLWNAHRAFGLIEEAESELGPKLKRADRPPLDRRRGDNVGEGSSAHETKLRCVRLDALERRRFRESLKSLVGEEYLRGGVELDPGSLQAAQELSLRRSSDLDLPTDWHCFGVLAARRRADNRRRAWLPWGEVSAHSGAMRKKGTGGRMNGKLQLWSEDGARVTAIVRSRSGLGEARARVGLGAWGSGREARGVGLGAWGSVRGARCVGTSVEPGGAQLSLAGFAPSRLASQMTFAANQGDFRRRVSRHGAEAVRDAPPASRVPAQKRAESTIFDGAASTRRPSFSLSSRGRESAINCPCYAEA